MSARGVHRAIHSALIDDPDFQCLSPIARLVLLVVRLCKQAGPAVIFRFYVEMLMRQTGLTRKQVDAALEELQSGQWIETDGVVLWVRNGLRYDPSMRLSDRKHRTAVERAVAELPKCEIIARFCNYYQITRPFDGPSKTSPDLALRIPIPIPNTDPEESTPSGAAAPAVVKAIKGSTNGSEAPTTPGSLAFESYSSAYQRRYGVNPVRNRKANSIFKHLSESIPAEEVPAVAAFYLTQNDTLYVRARHPVDLLKRDIESIRTAWATRDSRPDLSGGNQGPARELLKEFGRLYEAKIGSPYVGTDARDLGILEGLLAVKGTSGSPGFTVQTLKRMMAGFFRFPPQMVRDKDRFDLPMFKASFPELTRMLQRSDI